MAVSFHLVRADAYDRDAWASAVRALGKDLEDLRTKGSRLIPNFEVLCEDLFRALFKLVIQVVPIEEAPRSTLLAREVLRALVESDAFRELKEETSLDLARSAQGALTLARRALALLKSGEVLLEEELLTSQALARVEQDLDAKKGALEQAEKANSVLAETLREQVEQAEEEKESLEGEMDQVISGLPDRFKNELARTSERLQSDLPELEEKAQSFSRSMGANGPGDAASRLQLAEKLRSAKKLEQLAALAGAFRAEARAARKKNRERASEELYRVHRGRDLARVLPSELLALGHKVRRLEFLRRFVEGELQAYDLRGSDRHGRGPLVICLDGSGSMSGDRELWSKAVALALLEIARRQNRRARALVFSGPDSPVHAFELTAKAPGGRKPVDLTKVVALAECFPGGGTDFRKPLQAAAEVLAESRYQGGDVVFITDGEAQLEAAFVEEFMRLKREREFAVYGVIVDDPRSKNVMRGAPPPSRALDELKKVADQVTTVSRLTAESMRGIFEAL